MVGEFSVATGAERRGPFAFRFRFAGVSKSLSLRGGGGGVRNSLLVLLIVHLLLLALHSAVLEPSFHLSLAQLQSSGKFHAIGNAQVLFLCELGLQPFQLLLGEDGPQLSLSLHAVAEEVSGVVQAASAADNLADHGHGSRQPAVQGRAAVQISLQSSGKVEVGGGLCRWGWGGVVVVETATVSLSGRERGGRRDGLVCSAAGGLAGRAGEGHRCCCSCCR